MAGADTQRTTLSDAQIDEIVLFYARGTGETIGALATTYGVHHMAVTNALRRRGELQSQQENDVTEVAASEAHGMSAPDIDFNTILANPVMQDLIAKAVAERLTAMAQPSGAAPAAAANDPSGQFATMMSRMFEVLSMQQPGYKKPLPPEEVERRLAGKVEMDALLTRYRREWERNPSAALPKWRVGEKGFFECANALEFHEGDVFETWAPPVEDFEPLNTEARAVHAALMQHLGEATPDIGDQVRDAHLAANRPIVIPGAMQPAAVPTGPIRNIERAAPTDQPAARKRQLGTIVDEPRQIIGGHTSDPVGPTYQAA